MVSLSGSSVDSLRSHFRGELLVSGDAGYDEARSLWNGDIDRRPALIARAAASTMLPRRSGSPASTTSRSRCAAADTASRATASSTTA